MNDMNIVFVGVGGQGTLIAGKLLGRVAQIQNKDVKVSEVHGMSQRGGSVITYVRIGDKIYSPVIEEQMADFILAFEELEGLRAVSLLKKDRPIILNQQKILPSTCLTKQSVYPTDTISLLAEAGVRPSDIVAIPAYDIAKELGNTRTINIILMGALSVHMDISLNVWEQAINDIFSEKLRKINLDAFHRGRNHVQT